VSTSEDRLVGTGACAAGGRLIRGFGHVETILGQYVRKSIVAPHD